MSYQVLARKWRPHKFGDMIGQEHVLKALINALESDRLHHAYLFTGMRGVGKTTIARIFAKCLNCERAEHVTAEPCGECATCKDIDAGRFFDLIEVDAASRTKVDETRELLDNVPYAPTSGRYKVYLIDEVHMFSTHSFNALLKTLEEPPAHVKFLLATTDPQKVPVTVLSRCLQFNLKRMVPAVLADYLETILDAESIQHERSALDLIARAADGSVRDALSLVEQGAAYGQGAVKLDEVESMLGRVSVARLLDLLQALAAHDVNTLFQRVRQLAQYAPDFHELLGELMSLTHRIALLQSVPGSVETEASEYEQLQALANIVSAEDCQLWYQIGMHARRDMPFAPDPREAFDMALLRMLAFAPQGVNEVAVAPAAPAAAAEKPATQAAPAPAPKAAKAAPEPKVAQTASAPKATPAPAVEHQDGAAQDAPALAASQKAQLEAALGRAPKKKVVEAVAVEAVDTAPADPSAVSDVKHSEPTPAPVASSRSEEVANAAAPAETTEPAHSVLPFTNDHWPSIVRQADLAGLTLQLAMNTAIAASQNGQLSLRLPLPAQHLAKPSAVERLAERLSAYCGKSTRVKIDVTEEELVTPARLMEQAQHAAQAGAEESIRNDPVLAQLLSRVDGVVLENSVRPLEETPTD